MKIEISDISENEISKKGVFSWPIWSCEVSEFDWDYDQQESCLLLEGEVEVSSDIETVSFGAGDFVVFPRGLKCRWKIIKPVRKHYTFN
ncbi:MAG: cupin domain-containing protein [Candidatus Marinimicrobia bacterium]|nr:cupin domain-containing protein [Candidatus Neomarinimicrobiota bacterium]